MLGLRWLAVAAFSTLVTTNLSGPLPAAETIPRAMSSRPVDRLSVMTYNVKGLPFPAAIDRTGPLQQIGLRLAGLRKEGRAPHVVLLQEAFTPEAKQIAALAGYRYVAIGPQPGDVGPVDAMPAGYRAAARWFKGETQGKWVDSGLVIMSDFPIVATRKLAFAKDACAGFDCLASKGVLLAWIAVPGHARPLVIGDTHLNSRKATGVSFERANTAFAEQLGEVRRLVAGAVDARNSLILGGDFNIGHDPRRLRDTAARGGAIPGTREATERLDDGLNPDLEAVRKRAKDKQFFRAGQDAELALRAIEVPFGIGEGGYSLSDHLGYIATYEL